MAGPFIDISITGSKVAEKRLAGFEDKMQRKIVSNALVKSRTRNKKHILRKIREPGQWKQTTGDLARIWKSTKLVSKRRRGVIVRGIALPAEGMDAVKVMAIEYGHRIPGGGFVPPHSFIRAAVNENQAAELKRIGEDIEDNIEKTIRKLGR